MNDILNTGISNVKNPSRYIFGPGSINNLSKILELRRNNSSSSSIFFVDHYFSKNDEFLKNLFLTKEDLLIFIQTDEEPTTEYVDKLVSEIKSKNLSVCAMVGIGGGSTLDIAKAVSNLLTNNGSASDYQGWDLVKNPGVFKIGVPTISGTGSEATRTCVITNKKKKLKLGMNSDHSIFDQLILDPNLTATVPRDQYFFSGMDSYIHCIESLSGRYRNVIGDAYSRQALNLCRIVFFSENMQSDENRSNLMVASYLGGCAIATSYVGLIHPFSAGLSIVLGIHHCEANCLAFRALGEFYKDEAKEFEEMRLKQKIVLKDNLCKNLNSDKLDELYEATIVHEKPLTNALGYDFKDILTKEKVKSIFLKI